MIYLQPSYVHGMTPDNWGVLATAHGSIAERHLGTFRWGADNQAFTGKFDPERFTPG